MLYLHEVRREAENLITLHLDGSWSFAFDNAKMSGRRVRLHAQTTTVSRYLSARYTETESQTLLHEVAHSRCARAAHAPRGSARRAPSASTEG